MISFLEGKLTEALPTQVVIDVNGVGYEALIPLSSFDKLPQPGQAVRLLTHLAIRDDAHVLYGFMTESERELFRLLIRHVSGIGPKIALNVLSGTTAAAFRTAVAEGDVAALSRINGVGKKTAERMVIELKDKMGEDAAWPTGNEKPLGAEEQSWPTPPPPCLHSAPSPKRRRKLSVPRWQWSARTLRWTRLSAPPCANDRAPHHLTALARPLGRLRHPLHCESLQPQLATAAE